MSKENTYPAKRKGTPTALSPCDAAANPATQKQY
jgi:hypothetical protein